VIRDHDGAYNPSSGTYAEQTMPTKSKKSKVNPTIVAALIGLVGTLVTALLASPVLIELIKRSDAQTTSTANTSSTSTGTTLIFSQNFDDGSTSGFALKDGKWQVVRDESKRVLEFTAVGTAWPAGTMFFGPSNISDVVIEFQLKFKKLSGLYVHFREQENGDSYVISFDPNDSVVVWATTLAGKFAPVESAASQPFTFQQDVWYPIRVEARGEQVTVTISGNRTISGFDPQFSNGSLRFALQPDAAILLDDVNIWSADK